MASNNFSIARAVLAAATLSAALIATNRPASAQTPAQPTPKWAFLVSSGSVLPTGAQRDAIKRGNLTAAQLSYAIHPALAVTATVGWARSRDVATAGDPKLDVFTYDLGAEVRSPKLFTGRAVTLKPFAGIGAGARSYNYRSLDVDATHNIAAYGSAGGEIGIGRVGLRIEARDYVTGFKPLAGEGKSDTRNDVVVMAGLRLSTR